MKEMFKRRFPSENLIKVNFTNFSATNLQNTERMFYNCRNLNFLKLEGLLQNIKISKLVTMKEMFSNFSPLYNFTLENITFLELTNMESMFESCYPLKNVTFKNLHFYKSVSMKNMFRYNADIYSVFFKNINISKTLIIKTIFNEVNIFITKFEDIDASESKEIENICHVADIKEIDFKNIKISKISSIDKLFSCSIYNLYLENIDASQITKIENLFDLSYDLANISFISINLTKTILIKGLFKNKNHLENIIIKNITSDSLIDICDKYE